MTYIENTNTTSWSVSPSGDYNRSPELVPGQSYYFSITYVFDNGKISSNTARLTIPKASTPEPQPEPETEAPVSNSFVPSFYVSKSGSSLDFSWNPLLINS